MRSAREELDTCIYHGYEIRQCLNQPRGKMTIHEVDHYCELHPEALISYYSKKGDIDMTCRLTYEYIITKHCGTKYLNPWPIPKVWRTYPVIKAITGMTTEQMKRWKETARMLAPKIKIPDGPIFNVNNITA